jgi:hypothetical protein
MENKRKALGKGLEQLFSNERIDFENFEQTIEQVYFTVKEKSSDKNYVLQKTLNNGIKPDPNVSNRYILAIDADDTNDLKVNFNYVFDIQIVTAAMEDMTVKKTIVGGNLRLDDWDITSKRNEVSL